MQCVIVQLSKSDSGSTVAWGSKRINPRAQSCLCLTTGPVDTPSNDDDDDEFFKYHKKFFTKKVYRKTIFALNT